MKSFQLSPPSHKENRIPTNERALPAKIEWKVSVSTSRRGSFLFAFASSRHVYVYFLSSSTVWVLFRTRISRWLLCNEFGFACLWIRSSRAWPVPLSSSPCSVFPFNLGLRVENRGERDPTVLQLLLRRWPRSPLPRHSTFRLSLDCRCLTNTEIFCLLSWNDCHRYSVIWMFELL